MSIQAVAPGARPGDLIAGVAAGPAGTNHAAGTTADATEATGFASMLAAVLAGAPPTSGVRPTADDPGVQGAEAGPGNVIGDGAGGKDDTGDVSSTGGQLPPGQAPAGQGAAASLPGAAPMVGTTALAPGAPAPGMPEPSSAGAASLGTAPVDAAPVRTGAGVIGSRVIGSALIGGTDAGLVSPHSAGTTATAAAGTAATAVDSLHASDSPDPSPLGPRLPATEPSGHPKQVEPASVPTPAGAPGPSAPTVGSPAPAPTLAPATAQVVDHLTQLTRHDGTHRIRVRLQPESLGEVQVVMSVRHGEVQVRLTAGDAAAQLLAADAGELRRLLEQTGLSEARVQVRDGAGSVVPDSSGGSSQHRAGDDTGPDLPRARTPGEHPATDGDPGPAQAGSVPAPVRTRAAGLDLTM